MNKKLTFCMLGISAILLGGCASQQQAHMDYIGSDKAKTLALATAGYTTENVVFSDTVLDKRNDIDYYRVVFSANGQEYEYDIDALTGVVIADQTNLSSPIVPDAAPVSPEVAPSSNSETALPSNPVNGTTITEEEAKNSALTHAKLSADQVSFMKSKLALDDGKQIYDVEFYTSDYKEYDYEIDASTGTILSYDYDVEDYSVPDNTGKASSDNNISADKAKEIALAQVPGAAAEHILQFEADYDDGRLAYDGKIIYDGREYEFEIDGYSGAIREWDSEPVGH